MRLLLVVHDAAFSGALLGELSARRDAVEAWSAETFEEARAWLERSPFDAVLLAPGSKRLSYEGFVKRVGALAAPPALLVLGEDAPSARRIEPGSPRRVVDQLFPALGIARSALADTRVVEWLGLSGVAHLERVEWPGAGEPLVRASARAGEFEREALPLAQRVATLAGPGLAPTLECFWDDANPHTLQAVGPGVCLFRLMAQRPAEGVRGALALVRGVAEGVRTAHAAGVSAGHLAPSSIWLGADGSVQLLGLQLGQLPLPAPRHYGLAREAPPEEFGTGLAPQPEGDAYRLGVLLMRLAVDDDPVRDLAPFAHVRAEWAPELRAHREALGAAGGLIETLVQPLSGDRPRGELLFELVDALAPADWRAVVAEAVAWSLGQPYFVSM